MKKFFSLVLALVMALSLTTVAWGAWTGSGTGTDVDPYQVTTVAELEAAVAEGGYAKMMNVINITGDVILNPANPVTIDASGVLEPFNVDGGKLTLGAKVTINTDTALMGIYNGGEIVVNGAKITSTSTTYAAFDVSGGTMTVNEGSVLSCVGSVIGVNSGTLNIKGGTVSSSTAVAAAFVYAGTINVYGGEVKNGQDPADSCALIAAGDTAVVNVYGGTVESVLAHVSADSEVNIEGGTITKDVSAKDGGSVAISGGTVNGDVIENTGSTVTVSGGTFTTADVSEYVTAGNVFVNGEVKKTTSVGNTTVVDAKTLSVIDALGAEVDVSGITSIVKVAATTNKTTVDGKTTTTVVPTWYQLSDGTTSATFVECDKTSAEFMFTFKGVGSVYVREMLVPAAFDATPVTLYTAPLKATCEKVGQDNDVYVVIRDKYYATDSSVVPGAEQYALLSNGKMVVYYGEATAKAHNWASATVESWSDKTYATATSLKCPDCKGVIKVYTVPGTFDGKTYLQIPAGAAAGYYYVAGAVTTTVPGTVVVPSTDKVTSAETFDAGIAMYVGMSVMAAAGSAVVIGKKKD